MSDTATVDLVDLGYPSNFEDSMGLRTIKMIRPKCSTIKVGDTVVFEGCEGTPRWTKGQCPHNPYMSKVERSETQPEYTDLPDGRKQVTGSKKVVWHEERYNIEQVPLSLRVSNGRAPQVKADLGWKHPSEFGLKDFCQFINCYSQKITHRTASGDYCSEIHAKLITADENEDQLEILDPKKRARQLAQIAI